MRSTQKNRPFFKKIPRQEVVVDHAASGGPGGQHVNKTETKAILSWHVMNSMGFTLEERLRIQEKLANNINGEGYLIVQNRETRSQSQNEKNAFARMDELVQGALYIPKKRIKTKPTRGAKERRLNEKGKRANLKAQRSYQNWE